MWRKKAKPWDALSFRQLLTRKGPPTPAMASRWYYWEIVWFTVLIGPFMFYCAYALSVISPGYQPLSKVGYFRYFSRFLIINSHANKFGLLLIICGMLIIFLPHIQRRIDQWKITQPRFGRTTRWGMAAQRRIVILILATSFLLIAGITVAPLYGICWMSWGDFFSHSGGHLALFIVFSSFWLRSAPGLWQAATRHSEYGTRRFRHAGFIIAAWCGILAFPVLFWFIGHSFSAAAAPSPQATELQQYEMEARGGNIPAMRRLGAFYEKRDGASRNYQMALRWYKHAASLGDGRAMADIGQLYEHGRGGPRNYSMALTWYRLGAKAGSGRAMFHLGELFYNGRGVAENRSAAVAWWRRAARAGDAAAKKKLAQLRLPIYTTPHNLRP